MQAMMSLEGKRDGVVMKFCVDWACLVRGCGTVVRCGQGGVLRKWNQSDRQN